MTVQRPSQRHAQQARILQGKILQRFANLTEEEVRDLSPRAVVELWRDAVTVERQAGEEEQSQASLEDQIAGFVGRPTLTAREAIAAIRQRLGEPGLTQHPVVVARERAKFEAILAEVEGLL